MHCKLHLPQTWKLHAGNSGRLLEMLHGSDRLGKLVSELQQKEEEEVAHQLAIREGEAHEQQQQQQQPGSRRKRGQAQRDSFNPKASEHKSVSCIVAWNLWQHLYSMPSHHILPLMAAFSWASFPSDNAGLRCRGLMCIHA